MDLAIAYRVYKDLNPQGRLVNLGEWWSGFELGAGDEPQTAEATSKKKEKNGNGKKKGKKRARNDDDDDDDDDDDESSEGEEDDDGPERRKQARFLRAVADLAHLGFVHPTTRKPEHLLKSVY